MQDNKNDNLIEIATEFEYKKTSEKNIYPKGIINTDDYDNYLIFSYQWKNHTQRYYTLKNKKKIDLALSPNKVEEELKGQKVTQAERDIIFKINKEIYFLVLKSTLYKKRAFGDNSVKLTEDGFIIDELSGATPIIIELAGRFFKIKEIHRTLCEDMEITNVTINQINNVIKNNISKVKDLQEQYKKDYSDVRLGYKKSRLEELQDLYNNRKSIYNKSLTKEDEKQLLAILEIIKREVQGDLVINGSVKMDIEEKADRFVKQEALKGLNVTMLVISRIAGRMNVNPQLILSRLANSRYAQFTGFAKTGLSPTAISDPISYPSEILYDWGTIKNQNKIIVAENEKLAKLPELEDNQKENLNDVGKKLLEKLKEAKKPLDSGKKRIDYNS